ncbi:Leucine-rich repeat protein kinase family protein [Forsythia ovata]|uniref:Leucine-rich repeat protein kinase family protein n=1 Tax=Forsythia ovata TaxID=205694 RepID=A0ABD1PUL2_9LAMI
MLKDFERLSGLRSLLFSSNHLQGDIRLQVLSLFDNLLSGSLPGSIGNLSSQLSYLSVERNEVHGSIPSGIGNLPGLTLLSIADNDLDGPIPSAIGKLAELQEIYLGMNRFTNVLPSSLGNLSLLNHLYVQQNNIDGSIPPTLSNCSNLLTLDLSHNNLSDSVPREIMRLSSISISFNLAHNAFTGPIPNEVGSLINLVNLDLSHNRLSGFIPNSLSSCVSLQRLHLEANSLDGEIPRGLNALKGLQDLDLSQNNLSGPIPRFLGELPLVNLNLSFNRLQEEVPILGVFENKTAVSVDGNNELCGGIADLKLPPCSSTNSKKKNFPTHASAYLYTDEEESARDLPSSILSLEGQFLRLSYADLLKATNGFSEANLIGAGRFGSVYKGILDDGQTLVAVKVLNLHIKGASKSFISECNALRIVRYRNLLKLLSICQSTDFQGRDFTSLVYEYKSNGSLEKLLHQNRQQQGGQDERTSSLTVI